jgi:ketosteroid isomerase-like protein
MRCNRTAVILASWTLLGCSPSIDLESERQALLETDRAFARTAASGADASEVVQYWTSDARVYSSGLPELVGTDALLEMVAANAEIEGFSVTWEPLEAFVAESGDIGYTRGENALTFPGPDGDLVTTPGRYVTMWRKEADGMWRCFLELMNDAPTS